MSFRERAVPARLDPEAFRQPEAAFRPMIMWLWNADADLATLRQQVADMAANGFGGFFVHPMPDDFRKGDFIEGIRTPYLGESFLGWVAAAAAAARAHGMFCWLYDEGGWPSGTWVGRLAEGRPELAGRVLRVHPLGAGDDGDRPGDEVAVIALADGQRLRFYASREGYRTDLMNPATTDAFVAATHARYADGLGAEFGMLIPGIFTDEAAVGGAMGSDRVPWTAALPEEFRRGKGYDLLPHLAALFDPGALPPAAQASLSREQAARVRCDFGDVWTRLHAEAFYGRLHGWCRERGLLLVGHVGGEDDLANHATRYFGHFFRVMRHLDVPGVDAIWRQIFPGQAGGHFSKLAASAAHVAGKPLVLSETFAVYGYGLTGAQMKWVTDRQYCDGVNLMAPMAAHYSATRGRAYCTMSNLGWGNPLWPLLRTYCEYVGRLSYALRFGQPIAAVALLYPASSLWAQVDAGVAASFHAVMDSLAAAQIDYHVVDEEEVARATVESGWLRCGGLRYAAVLLVRSPVLDWPALARLVEFATAGGAVLAVDSLPWLCPQAAHQERLQAAVAALFGGDRPRCRYLPPGDRPRLPAVLAELIARDFVLETPDPDIRYCHRVWRDGDLYFVVNGAATGRELRVELAGSGAAEIWDPDRGSVAPAAAQGRGARTRLTLELPPLGALFVVLRRGEPATPASSSSLSGARQRLAARPLAGPWEIAPVRACRLIRGEPQEEATPPGGEQWRPVELRPWAALGLLHFSGSIAYRTTVALSAGEAARGAVLDLGQVRHAAQVWVNGRAAGVRLWPPWTVEVAGTLRPGPNELRVVVTNTWANQFLQPEEIAWAQAQGWYNAYARRTEPFQRESLEAGLLGPVRLLLRAP